MVRRLTLFLILLGLGAGAFFLLPRLPDAWNPLAPLRLDEPAGPFMRVKLWRLTRDPAACRASLETAGRSMPVLPDASAGANCPLTNTVRLVGGAALEPARPVVTCPMAVAWTLYERDVLDPAAERHFGSGISRVRHLGTLACRNVRGGSRRSQHASANAIDLAGLRLDDGREVTVLAHWDEAGPRGAFLREARDGACGIFGAVLGPERDAAHRNHFHLDLGRARICR